MHTLRSMGRSNFTGARRTDSSILIMLIRALGRFLGFGFRGILNFNLFYHNGTFDCTVRDFRFWYRTRILSRLKGRRNTLSCFRSSRVKQDFWGWKIPKYGSESDWNILHLILTKNRKRFQIFFLKINYQKV